MTNAAQKLIDSFEALPEAEQHEVLAQLLHRLIDSPYASFSDEDFTQSADMIFKEFDRRSTP
ncbi:MAG: hypothetical protein ACREU9_10200 [Gammaproteobacteria bacterium]